MSLIHDDYDDKRRIVIETSTDNIFGNFVSSEEFIVLDEIYQRNRYDNKNLDYIELEFTANAINISKEYKCLITWIVKVPRCEIEFFDVVNVNWSDHQLIYQIEEIDDMTDDI